MPRGRPKGSKNRKQSQQIADRVQVANKFATTLIAYFHLDGAEKVAQMILERVRAQQVTVNEKYGGQ